MSVSTPLRFDFRPRSYFLTDLDTAVLSRIKGRARRAAVRSLGTSKVDAPMVAESLSADEREAVGRVHPSLMGGEYLPDLDAWEVEIARIELESTTADVISLRARRVDKKIHYRLVDEYDTAYLITPASSDEPLTFGAMVELITTIQREGEFWFQALREAHGEDFIHVSSEFYPQLAAYFEAEAEQRAERTGEPAPTRAGFPPPEQCMALHGAWEVKYPGPDEMIRDDYIERLELRDDGTFTWNPTPAWAPQTGNWSVEITQDSTLRLGFEDRWGGIRWNFLVLMQLQKGGPYFLNWQRTSCRGAVIFSERIFRADRPHFAVGDGSLRHREVP